MLNLAVVLEDSARQSPDKTAVIAGSVQLTFQQMNQAANRIASGLASKGIGPGDKVAMSVPNLPFFPMVYYGILKTGATVVPLNVLFKKEEITYHLNDSQAVAYFCFQGTPALPMGEMGKAGFEGAEGCAHFWMITADGKPLADGTPTLGELMASGADSFETACTQPTDTAVILYTSGTTGQPKGAELTHHSILLNAMMSKDIMVGRRDDIHLVCLPLFHSFGQVCQMNQAMFAGATQVYLPRFEAQAAWDLLVGENVTVFCGVPTMYWALLHQTSASDDDLKKVASTLRICCSGGAPMPVEIMKDFEKAFDVPILEGYGLSETSPVATFSRTDMPRKPGSVGVPIWGVEVKIFDAEDKEVGVGESGEIAIRGHNVMKGYYRRPDATANAIRDSWFRTGDVGKLDEDGYLYIVDRVKDMIIRGGFNVYPRELEEVLLEHPGVSLAAVIGVPDMEHGEEVKAFVVPKDGHVLDPEAVIAWTRERMAAYKYPRFVEVRSQLPMTATGKILKTQLRQEET